MKLVKVLLLLAIAGCQTVAPPKPEPILEQKSEQKSEQKVVRCKGTKMIGWKSEAEMTDMDKSSYNSAKKRCPQLFLKSPCLVSFEKRKVNTYRAICGEALPE